MPATSGSNLEAPISLNRVQSMLGVEGTGEDVRARLMQRIDSVLQRDELLTGLARDNNVNVDSLRTQLGETRRTLQAATTSSEQMARPEAKTWLGRLGSGLKSTGSFLWRNKWWILAAGVAAYLGYGYYQHYLNGIAHQGATIAPVAELSSAAVREGLVGPVAPVVPTVGAAATPDLIGGGGTYIPSIPGIR